MVAPRVGAWIETPYTLAQLDGLLQSRPAWARGLKLFCLNLIPLKSCRAPRGRVD